MSKSACHADLIGRLARTTSTPGGTDATLQILSYGSPLVAAALIKLVQLRASGHALAGLIPGDNKRLLRLAGGVTNAGASIGEARVVIRLLGLLPMIDWLLRLHPQPVKALLRLVTQPSLANFDLSNEKVFSTIRVLLLSGFYVCENTAWLANKGVLELAPETVGKLAQWSIRSWAVDVFLTAGKLLIQRSALAARSRQLGPSSSEGYEVNDEKSGDVSSQRAQLKAEWVAWEQAAKVNFGWIPLTIHWSYPGGVWTNPLITYAIGSFVAWSKFGAAWSKA